MRLPIIEDFLALLFPKTCCLCKKSLYAFEDQLCNPCIAQLPMTNYHLRPEQNDLSIKIQGLSQVGRVMAFLRFTKKGQSQQLLHQLKYRNRPDLGHLLGKLYGQLLLEHGMQKLWDQVSPVPLHPAKQRRRGYNQSEQFALGLGASLQIPVQLSLERKVYTETQTKKSRLERLDNVSEVFGVQGDVSGKKILLVDDVMTTGATLVSCANTLLKHHAQEVDLAVIAAGRN